MAPTFRDRQTLRARIRRTWLSQDAGQKASAVVLAVGGGLGVGVLALLGMTVAAWARRDLPAMTTLAAATAALTIVLCAIVAAVRPLQARVHRRLRAREAAALTRLLETGPAS